ncbi:MAG: Cof-type HAD-IIB family hydrolase [Bacteroidota bacterium]|nr:Cof-type HAD-IIB family hydrolase [Bacteroidota bacterium]MDP4217595.1 Cof-type HAD-IIB family hydrolase [Bacteroidota bacterium]MDP4248445.1 Cof-type HAD-IIB family hydrolase [Bacteroidota bacterium]MDP4255179.1 Cof-type HAD-IIB family hydrolase [Bacteroidota bacterium]
MYSAVFLDMDGTLLRSDHSVSEETIRTIKGLTGNGISVTLVSARPLDAMLPTARQLGLAGSPLVSLNGGYITQGEKPLFQSSIDLATTAGVTLQVQPFGSTIAYYLQREWFAETDDSWTRHEQKIMDVRLQVAPFPELMRRWSARGDGAGPNKMMVMSEPKTIALIEKQLLSLYDRRLNIYPSKPTYLEVMEPAASKANAVRMLIARMNIPREQTIAIGDNFNDREMIEFAGMGVAMGNAPDEIKAVADYVTDSNNNDGVRKALEKLIR